MKKPLYEIEKQFPYEMPYIMDDALVAKSGKYVVGYGVSQKVSWWRHEVIETEYRLTPKYICGATGKCRKSKWWGYSEIITPKMNYVHAIYMCPAHGETRVRLLPKDKRF